MLQYFSWKKFRAHKDAAAAKETATSESAARTGAAVAVDKTVAQSQKPEGPQPVISHHDEAILCKHLENVDEERIVILEGSSGATTPRPGVLSSPTAGALSEAKDSEKGEWVAGFKSRLGGLRRTVSSAAQGRRVKPKSPGPSTEEKGKWKEEVGEGKEAEKLKQKEVKSEERQADEFTAALEGLNLSTEDGRAFSVTPATQELLDNFIQILKDLANGVPTAYQDLVDLFDSSSKTLEDTFTSLPSFLQRIIRTVPKKMQANLTPELLRTAAAVSPAAAELEVISGMLPTLKELVTKPGLVMGLLKSVVNLLKTRFPAMLGGSSVALSMAIFVLLFVLWYCYKRGREVRLDTEAASMAAEGSKEDSAAAPKAVIRDKGKKKGV